MSTDAKPQLAEANGSTLPIVPGPITIDPSDPEVQFILSKTCLFCARIAHVFQRAGYPIPQQAEDEQMHVLLWMLARYREHGNRWRAKCDEELRALRQTNAPAQPRREGGVE